jgi:hypothetical protein
MHHSLVSSCMSFLVPLQVGGMCMYLCNCACVWLCVCVCACVQEGCCTKQLSLNCCCVKDSREGVYWLSGPSSLSLDPVSAYFVTFTDPHGSCSKQSFLNGSCLLFKCSSAWETWRRLTPWLHQLTSWPTVASAPWWAPRNLSLQSPASGRHSFLHFYQDIGALLGYKPCDNDRWNGHCCDTPYAWSGAHRLFRYVANSSYRNWNFCNQT